MRALRLLAIIAAASCGSATSAAPSAESTKPPCPVTTPPPIAVTPPPATGSLTVTTTTTGSNLPAGYTVTLDTGQSGTIGANDSITATGIAAGDHTLTLSGVPGNCTLGSPNPQAVTITAGSTTQVGFAISCTAAGP